MSRMQLFAKLTKVDAENRLVYGRAVDESPDRSGEVFDYATSKGHFEKWSQDAQEATDGKSFGNLRAMHGKVAAGKLTGITFDDVGKSIDVCAHVVDDAEWKKVEEGVYTGFSIGGSYLKKWDDAAAKKADGKALKRYTAAPSELSLVDRPCIPSASFYEIHKADGVVEQATFKSVLTEETIEAKARELCKEDGADPELIDTTNGANIPLWKSYVEKAEAALIDQGDVAEDAKPEANEPSAQGITSPTDQVPTNALKADGPAAQEPVEYQVDGTDEEVSKLATIMHDQKLAMKDVLAFVDDALVAKSAASAIAKEADTLLKLEEHGTLKKGMYLVAQLAQIVSQLDSMRQSVVWEEKAEGDTQSVLPTKAGNLLSVATDLLRYMVEEESAEILNPDGDQDINAPVLAMAHFGELKKIGARNSKSDTNKIQAAHDLLAGLGATCATKEAAAPIGDLAKLGDDVMCKVEKVLADALGSSKEALQKLESSNKDLMEKVAKLEAQPAPARGVLRAISKGSDVVADDNAPAIQPVVKNGEVNEAASLIKMAHQSGGIHMGLRPDGSPV